MKIFHATIQYKVGIEAASVEEAETIITNMEFEDYITDSLEILAVNEIDSQE